MTISLGELARYTDSLLETQSTPDYPNAVNGVQMHNQAAIRKIAAAVDFSTRAIQGAISSGANLLVVHHGMFWGGLEPITGSHYRRVRMLIEADIAVYAAHLPLDRHPTLGNNALLARELGLQPSDPFARFEETFTGFCGNLPGVLRKHTGAISAHHLCSLTDERGNGQSAQAREHRPIRYEKQPRWE
jgi:putative NIF3 family GTP cyclohydrolase 1 type 2